MARAQAPPRNDGGASEGALPHDVSGVLDRVKASVPPVATKDSGSHVLVEATPLTFRPVTYSPVPVPAMVIFLPAPVFSTTFGNSGEPSTSSARPGISGYMPSADHTY